MDHGTSLERPYKKLLNGLFILKLVTPNSSYGQSKTGLKNSSISPMHARPLVRKIDPSQNMDQSASLERSYKELLKLKTPNSSYAWAVKVIDTTTIVYRAPYHHTLGVEGQI